MEWGLKMAVIQIISAVIGVVITAFVVDALAPCFGSEKNMNKSAQLVAYGYTPAFLGAMLTIYADDCLNRKPCSWVVRYLFNVFGY